jgi:glutathione synthase/RimK-type ligase-like ATP-grasp enzyme
LRELEAAGIPTIPTAWEGEVPWDDAIVKPTVAGGSLGLRRAKRGEPIEAGHMAQPFLPEIMGGELSLLFFDGEFSHAIRKTPAEGDIRVQPEHGGIVTAEQPTDAQLALGRRVLDAAGRDLLYARVDLVADDLLIELEAIEPRLYFRYAPPQAAGNLAQALRRRN